MTFATLRRLGATVAATALLAACATSDSAPAVDAYADPDPATDAPAMWAVSDDDSTVYLFGTFHLLPPELEWQTAAFTEAMAASGFTYFEADVMSPEAQAEIMALVQQYGLNPPGTTLSATLGEERAARIAAFAEQYGVPMAALEQLKPWLAMLTLTQQAYAAAGFNPAAGVDVVIDALAKEEGDEIGYLEGAEAQILAIQSLGSEEALAAFDENFEDLANLDAFIAASLEAWRTGDVAALDEELLEESRQETPAVFEAIFANRNRNWVPTIEALLARDEDVFVAVGAGHLVGEESVTDMLIERGYSPRRIQ